MNFTSEQNKKLIQQLQTLSMHFDQKITIEVSKKQCQIAIERLITFNS
ncbi:unnamed protein product [Paramecium octaurelia]|uniref:Uncharacterized protein n=1 Tax=Paramecium octaurelia TaxID=43137 RepID=A0A8S1XX18_PAROT|nr:unnamed protein product [Paramecium octaurelia]